MWSFAFQILLHVRICYFSVVATWEVAHIRTFCLCANHKPVLTTNNIFVQLASSWKNRVSHHLLDRLWLVLFRQESAWAVKNMAERAKHLGKMGGTSKSKSHYDVYTKLSMPSLVLLYFNITRIFVRTLQSGAALYISFSHIVKLFSCCCRAFLHAKMDLRGNLSTSAPFFVSSSFR